MQNYSQGGYDGDQPIIPEGIYQAIEAGPGYTGQFTSGSPEHQFLSDPVNAGFLQKRGLTVGTGQDGSSSLSRPQPATPTAAPGLLGNKGGLLGLGGINGMAGSAISGFENLFKTPNPGNPNVSANPGASVGVPATAGTGGSSMVPAGQGQDFLSKLTSVLTKGYGAVPGGATGGANPSNSTTGAPPGANMGTMLAKLLPSALTQIRKFAAPSQSAVTGANPTALGGGSQANAASTVGVGNPSASLSALISKGLGLTGSALEGGQSDGLNNSDSGGGIINLFMHGDTAS